MSLLGNGPWSVTVWPQLDKNNVTDAATLVLFANRWRSFDGIRYPAETACLPPPVLLSRKIDKMDATSPLEEINTLNERLYAMGKRLQSLGYPDEGLTGSEELKAVARDYNHVVEQIQSLKETPRFDPVERLPEEVWLAVLKETTTTSWHGFWILSIETTLFLTSVSSKWRQSIESMPLLWSDIVLDDQTEDLAMKVTVGLNFSDDVPLTVLIVGPMGCWDSTNPIVLPHKERIQRILVAEGESEGIQVLFSRTVPHLSTPELRGIYVTSSSYKDGMADELFLMDQGPLIRSVSILALSRATLELAASHNLSELATYEQAGYVVQRAEGMPRLMEVHIGHPYGVAQNWAGADDQALSRPQSQTALNWTLLFYEQPAPHALTSLLTRLPLLVSLWLDLALDFLPQTIAAMQNLNSLSHLTIYFMAAPTKDFISPVITRPLTTVQIFRSGSPWFLPGQEHLSMMSQVPDAFFALLPNVEILDIHAYMFWVCALASEKGFQKTHTLIVASSDDEAERSWDPMDSPPRLVLPSRIKALDLDNGRFPDTTHGIYGMAIESLQLTVFQPSSAGFGRHPDHEWSLLKKLHTPRFHGTLGDFESFSSLTRLHVHPVRRSSEAVTESCVFLATFPQICPALDTLLFGRFPELDILFIMLERRNQASDPTRAQIRDLSLPNRVSPFNLKTISNLLRGRVVERQSNFEASVYSNMELLFQPDV